MVPGYLSEVESVTYESLIGWKEVYSHYPSAFAQRAAISASSAPGQYNNAPFPFFSFFFSLAHIDDDDIAPHVSCPSLTSSTAAYKHADGKKIDGRRVLVDVERGRTVKGWHPRRLGQLKLLLNVDQPQSVWYANDNFLS